MGAGLIAGSYSRCASRCAGYWSTLVELVHLMTNSYRVMPALTSELQEEAHRVRHRVYCSELNYEESNSAGIEKDDFDHHATQMVVYSRSHKAFVGCLRLVHGRYEGTSHRLPFEHHCGDKIDRRILSMVKSSGYNYAEVSRLAIDADHRQRGKNHDRRVLGGRRKSSFALLSLYLGLQAMARQQNVRYLLAVVEPRLLNSLRRYGIPAIQIGQGVDHRGLRVPILMDVEEIERIIPSFMKLLYNRIKADVASFLPAMRENPSPAEAKGPMDFSLFQCGGTEAEFSGSSARVSHV